MQFAPGRLVSLRTVAPFRSYPSAASDAATTPLRSISASASTIDADDDSSVGPATRRVDAWRSSVRDSAIARPSAASATVPTRPPNSSSSRSSARSKRATTSTKSSGGTPPSASNALRTCSLAGATRAAGKSKTDSGKWFAQRVACWPSNATIAAKRGSSPVLVTEAIASLDHCSWPTAAAVCSAVRLTCGSRW